MMMMMMELEKEEKLEVKATLAATAAASKYKFFERHSVSLSLERPYDNIKINNFLCYLKSVCDLKPSICKIKTLVKNKGKKKKVLIWTIASIFPASGMLINSAIFHFETPVS